MKSVDRRDFLKLSGMAGVTFTAGLFPAYQASAQAGATSFRPALGHPLGLQGPANPDAEHTLKKAIATVNGLAQKPDFIVFTGDLTHTTDDRSERRKRMSEFKRDRRRRSRSRTCASWPASTTRRSTTARPSRSSSAPTHYTFDHKGVHFIALDNVSDPARQARRRSSSPGWPPTSQAAEPDARIVVLRPTARCSTSTRSGTGPRATAPRRSTC